MNLPPPATDNVSELLAEIVVFTQARRNILTQNIRDLDEPGFVPKDLAVEEFSHLLNHAIAEHIQNERLVLRDTANIKFGPNGSLRLKPVVDEIPGLRQPQVLVRVFCGTWLPLYRLGNGASR